MKEIGEQFKHKREEIGITVEEVSTDLKVDPIIIENFEEGNSKVFKDVLELKELIESYAKYLGLNTEKINDEFNDYLFEKTSKISLEDIKERLEKQKVVTKNITSPYTLEAKEKENKYRGAVILLIIALILIVLYFVLKPIFIM